MFCVFILLMNACSDEGGTIVGNSSKIKGSKLSLVAAAPCSESATSCTPSNLSGRIFAAGALIGQNSDGEKNYNMTFLASSEEVINDPSDPSHPPGEMTFDLLSPVVFSGLISIPSEEDMPLPPVVSRIESYFDYVDTAFVLSGTSTLDDSYVIRTVMRKTAIESDVTGTMKLGDKLIRKSSEEKFRWCDASSCDHSKRPEKPLQDENILAIDSKNDSQPGNPDYALYSIDFTKNLTVTYEQISDPTHLWSLDFDVSNAISFKAVPSTLSNEVALVTNFSLAFGCNTRDCETNDNCIKATLSIGDPGSAKASEEEAEEP